MIKKLFGTMIALTALGAGALAATAVVLGNKRVDEWETLTLDDAEADRLANLAMDEAVRRLRGEGTRDEERGTRRRARRGRACLP